jgi:hypothetical protein
LQKATHQNHKKDGAEKVDILHWLAQDVKTSIENGRQMRLEEGELVKFLEKEDMAPSDKKDIRQAVDKLLELRKREMDRHVAEQGQVKKVDSEGDNFQEFRVVLYEKSPEEVSKCFALAIRDEN